jgi:hypothetical protein
LIDCCFEPKKPAGIRYDITALIADDWFPEFSRQLYIRNLLKFLDLLNLLNPLDLFSLPSELGEVVVRNIPVDMPARLPWLPRTPKAMSTSLWTLNVFVTPSL